MSYCRELERRTKHLDPVHFLQFVDCIDVIVTIRMRLQQDKTKACKKDEDDTFAHLARLRDTIKILIKNCEPKVSLKEFIDIEHLARKTVEKGLENHIKAIAGFTKNCSQ